MTFQRIGPSGLTKAWRGVGGERKLTFREGAETGLTFTVFLSRACAPLFLYASIRMFRQWARVCWSSRSRGIV